MSNLLITFESTSCLEKKWVWHISKLSIWVGSLGLWHLEAKKKTPCLLVNHKQIYSYQVWCDEITVEWMCKQIHRQWVEIKCQFTKKARYTHYAIGSVAVCVCVLYMYVYIFTHTKQINLLTIKQQYIENITRSMVTCVIVFLLNN